MALLKLRIQPGWQQGNLTMQFVQDNVIVASGANGAAIVAQEGPAGAQTTFASDTVDLDPANPGNTTSAGIGIIQCVDVSLTIVAEEQAEIDANGALVPPQSNAGFDAKLDQIIADGAKELTLASHDTGVNARLDAQDAQLVSIEAKVDIVDQILDETYDWVQHIPTLPSKIALGGGWGILKTKFTSKDDMEFTLKDLVP